ncbi:uncharacterized protein BKA78DRAFT_3656 [Phyllosticta capitalensis]|uniref:uncharacterized protein n=1 Tax=Phyllosticta capitalensis TaxID=121624 RepID=UPI00312E2151
MLLPCPSSRLAANPQPPCTATGLRGPHQAHRRMQVLAHAHGPPQHEHCPGPAAKPSIAPGEPQSLLLLHAPKLPVQRHHQLLTSVVHSFEKSRSLKAFQRQPINFQPPELPIHQNEGLRCCCSRRRRHCGPQPGQDRLPDRRGHHHLVRSRGHQLPGPLPLGHSHPRGHPLGQLPC